MRYQGDRKKNNGFLKIVSHIADGLNILTICTTSSQAKQTNLKTFQFYYNGSREQKKSNGRKSHGDDVLAELLKQDVDDSWKSPYCSITKNDTKCRKSLLMPLAMKIKRKRCHNYKTIFVTISHLSKSF